MTANAAAIRRTYQVAEEKNVVGWMNCFTKDGPFFFDPSKKNLSPSLPFRIYVVPLRKEDGK